VIVVRITNCLQEQLLATEDSLAAAQEAVEAAKAEAAEMKTHSLRTMADMENLRVRTNNQIADAKTFAIQGFAKSILEVADTLERAVVCVPADMVADGTEADRETLLRNLQHLRTGVVLTDKVRDPCVMGCV
jgi:molecular chaperone GrpE